MHLLRETKRSPKNDICISGTIRSFAHIELKGNKDTWCDNGQRRLKDSLRIRRLYLGPCSEAKRDIGDMLHSSLKHKRMVNARREGNLMTPLLGVTCA